MLAKFSLFLLLVMSVTSENHNDNINNNNYQHYRTKRAESGFWGFFQKIGSFTNILVEQYTDSKTTLQKLYEVLQDNFSDTATTTARPLDENDAQDNTTKTTTEKYRISRYETGRILGRNFRGLQKLLRLELNDALNQSNYNIIDYQREISNAIGPQIISVNKQLTKRKRKIYKRRAQKK